MIKLELARLRIEDVSDEVTFSCDKGCSDDKTKHSLSVSKFSSLNDIGSSIQRVLLVLLSVIDIFGSRKGVFNHRNTFSG